MAIKRLRVVAPLVDGQQKKTTDGIAAVPTTHSGTIFRSELEADWAATLDHYRITWQYEPKTIRLPSGTWYLPDFWLPALHTFIEVKGAHMQRAAKPEELAREVDLRKVIVLIGFPPHTRSTDGILWDRYLQWRDPLRYDTRFARCGACRGWQWVRAQLSRRCRLCDAVLTGTLANAGEMPFFSPDSAALSWLGAH